MFFSGIFTGVFVRYYGPRKVAILGGFVSSFGILLSAFSPWIELLYVTYGAIAGKDPF